jgi:hypothetical protein
MNDRVFQLLMALIVFGAVVTIITKCIDHISIESLCKTNPKVCEELVKEKFK